MKRETAEEEKVRYQAAIISWNQEVYIAIEPKNKKDKEHQTTLEIIEHDSPRRKEVY